MKRLSLLAASVAVLFVACDSITDTDTVQAPDADLAARAGQTVDVIVALDPAMAPGGQAANRAAAERFARGLGFAPTHSYGTALFGFAAAVPEGRLRGLERNPRVAYVERDGIASIPQPRFGTRAPPWCGDNPDHPACSDDDTDDGGGGGSQVTPWGVTRVGGPADGTGTTAWIIDTGIDLDHADLNVDVSRSVNFANGKDSPDDGNGHGTHVAGTVGAIDNGSDVVGVAAGATLVAVRVLGNSGSGSISDVVAGVDYVAANGSSGDAANMSLGASGHFQSLHDAVVNAAQGGIRFSIAAGNSDDDAADYEPAHVEHSNVYTVAAIDDADCLASWSNWGNPPIEFAAPGVSILSTANKGGTTTMSGTSMAAPHVGGLLLVTLNSDGTASCDPDGDPDPIAHR